MCRLKLYYCLIVSWLFLLCGCATSVQPTAQSLRYAKLLRMTEHPDHTWVEIINPWDTTQVLRQYLLVDQAMSSSALEALQAQHSTSVLLRAPLQRILPQSTVHASLALWMGAQQSLVGLCDTAYIIAPELKQLHLPDFGRGDQPNLERILAVQTDVCLFAPFENTRYASLERAGIPIVDCADYLETSPLGRAEWMRFYGRLWGKSQLADSLFAQEVQHYDSLVRIVQASTAQRAAHPLSPSTSSSPKNLANTTKVGVRSQNVRDISESLRDNPEKVRDNLKNLRDNLTNLRDFPQSLRDNDVRSKQQTSANSATKVASSTVSSSSLQRPPRVWLDLPWQSTWYVPGGSSYLATLIADAGGDYPLRHNTQAGSLPLPLERAWQYAQKADVWVIKGGDEVPSHYAALKEQERVYAQFPAVRSHRVWVCNTMQVPYYEYTPFAPAQLLREWCIMLGTLPSDSSTTLRYFHPLSK